MRTIKHPIVHLFAMTLLTVGFAAPPSAYADSTTAVWYGEIWEYGIVSSGGPEDTLRPMIPL